jgi:isoleucyl-tRNA synthetase
MKDEVRRFAPVPASFDLPAIERRILEFWKQGRFFEQLRAKNRGGKRFSFLDGPITANNPMGVHHAWGRTYKDLFQRFKAMQGYDQRYQNGFDCQGLWVEVEVEKELQFKSKRDIETYGIARFVEKCKDRVRRYSQVITDQSVRIGQWMDWENSYYTMSDENNYAIWHFLKKCHERGLVYKGHDVMPWCARCGTATSNMEITTEGYQEMTHPAVYLRFPIRERSGEFLMVWTTTPWTLTANVAVAVHPEMTYVKVREKGSIYYIAKRRVQELKSSRVEEFKSSTPQLLNSSTPQLLDSSTLQLPNSSTTSRSSFEVLEELTGDKLVGLSYEGPFDELPAQQGIVHRVVAWDEVLETEGTGMVHIAPGCGKEDFVLGKEEKLAVVAPLDEAGVFVDGFAWLTGKPVSEVAPAIFEDLERKGRLYRVEDYAHRYPVCWRCGTELVFRLVDEWFIRMDELRGEIMEIARQVRWIPEFGLERETDWLTNMADWCISRKRYWGLALPIFECACGHFEVIGDRDELASRAVEGWARFEGHTPHRPWVDEVKIKCPKCTREVSRISDVGTPWLDAGIVPYSTIGYFRDRDYWQQWFPPNFITECFPGQYRNWFYAILTMSTVLENKPPFRVLLGHATVRDETGRDMHKSGGNAIEAGEAAEKMGADIMRWIFVRQNPSVNLNFGYSLGPEVQRKLLTLWNVYSFFVTYARIDGWRPEKCLVPDVLCLMPSVMDRWIVSRLNGLIRFATERLEDYDPAPVPREIERFVDDLSVWYVRRCRRRFWKSSEDRDKLAAYHTLYRCLIVLVKLIAPIMPFLSEEIYQNLVAAIDPAAPASVHLCAWPQVRPEERDEKLETEMALVRKLVSLGHAAREKAGIKVRQPLASVFIQLATGHEYGMLDAYREMIKEELNVKKIVYAAPQQEKGEGIREKGEISPFALRLSPFRYVSETDDSHVVAVNVELTDELRNEGLARELVRRVQNLRKEAGFDVADRIRLSCAATPAMTRAIQAFGDYIRQEVLAVAIERGAGTAGEMTKDFKIGGEQVTVTVARIED